jgi:DNA-binding MarR family transcriptional regulator
MGGERDPNPMVESDERGEPLYAPGFGAWIKIGVVYQKTHRHLANMLKSLGLTVAQFDALANLYMSDAISQQLLAERLLVTKGNVTGVVNRLAERGWAVRKDDPDDRRTNRIELTAEGRKLAKRALVIQRNLVDEMTAGLTKSEREELRTLLTRLASKIEEMENG